MPFDKSAPTPLRPGREIGVLLVFDVHLWAGEEQVCGVVVPYPTQTRQRDRGAAGLWCPPVGRWGTGVWCSGTLPHSEQAER